MDRNATLAQVRSLSVDDQFWLVHEVLDGISDDPTLTEAQKQELDRRIADMEANPTDEVPWEQAYVESLKRVRR